MTLYPKMHPVKISSECANAQADSLVAHARRLFSDVVAQFVLIHNTVDSLSRTRITAYLEVKILSLPKHENLTTSKKYCRKEEKLLLRSNFSSFPQSFRYTCISNLKSPITYKFVKCGSSNYFFLSSENLICRGTDISK